MTCAGAGALESCPNARVQDAWRKTGGQSAKMSQTSPVGFLALLQSWSFQWTDFSYDSFEQKTHVEQSFLTFDTSSNHPSLTVDGRNPGPVGR